MGAAVGAGGRSSWVVGALAQVVDELASVVPVPVDLVRVPAPVGDVLETRGGDARRGADLVDAALHGLATTADPSDPSGARLRRPLLTTTDVTAVAGTPLRLTFTARADGADWGAAAWPCSWIAVYVDSRYLCTTQVLAERTERSAVLLGRLAPGRHHVELRDASALAGPAAPHPVVADVSADALSGDDALAAAHAPVLELRTDGAGPTASHTDAPLLVVPVVTHRADGSTLLEYRVVFSDEDGGTAAPDRLARYGRTVDLEPVLHVELAADGHVVRETYQCPVHRWADFDGARVGGRPVLRVSTPNNLVSARIHARGVERWADAPTAVVEAGAASDDLAVLDAHPWTWALSAAELTREGTASTAARRGAWQVAPLRQHLFLGALTDAQLGAVLRDHGIDVDLRDGRRLHLAAGPGTARQRGTTDRANRNTALELPAGVDPTDVAVVHLPGARATVLDAALLPHQVRAAA